MRPVDPPSPWHEPSLAWLPINRTPTIDKLATMTVPTATSTDSTLYTACLNLYIRLRELYNCRVQLPIATSESSCRVASVEKPQTWQLCHRKSLNKLTRIVLSSKRDWSKEEVEFGLQSYVALFFTRKAKVVVE